MFYDLKVTFEFVWKVLRPYSDIWEFGILLTEDFYEVLLSLRFLRGYVRHYTQETIVAHIPCISQYRVISKGVQHLQYRVTSKGVQHLQYHSTVYKPQSRIIFFE